MMTLEFDVCPQEYLAATRLFMARSRLVDVAWWLGFLAGPLAGLAIAVHGRGAWGLSFSHPWHVLSVNGRTFPGVDWAVFIAAWALRLIIYVGLATLLWYFWWRRIARAIAGGIVEGRARDVLRLQAYWGRRRLEVDDDGLRLTSPIGQTSIRWWAVREILERGPFLYITLATGGYIYVPPSCFATPADAQDFRQFVSERIQPTQQHRAE